MAPSRCPSCSAQVPPGDLSCRRCGYDFILGRRPDERRPLQDARLRRSAMLGALAAVLLVAGLSALVMWARERSAPPPGEPCLAPLAELHAAVLAAQQRGNEIPRCAATPPGPAVCWASTGANPMVGTEAGLSFTVRPSVQGFDLECSVDADGDGHPAVYKANAEIRGVKISAPGVR